MTESQVGASSLRADIGIDADARCRGFHGDMANSTLKEPTISAYIQCYSNKAALYQTLFSFRKFYPSEAVTLVSDRGDDFRKFAEYFGLHYYRSEQKCDPRGALGKDGAREYLKRIYEHC